MERKITVYNTKTQRRYDFNSVANTLADLKADLDLHEIDYSDLDFTEGVSNTQLLDDTSLLPSNLNYKGKVTNDLVILLTNTKKKNSLGAYTRKEAYAKIKELGMEEKVKEAYGKNYTLVSTENLSAIIDEAADPRNMSDFNIADAVIRKYTDHNTSKQSENQTIDDGKPALDYIDYDVILCNALSDVIEALYDEDVLEEADIKHLIMDLQSLLEDEYEDEYEDED